MKRSLAVQLLANVISNRNTGHYSYNETEHANEVLILLESLGLVQPTHKVTVTKRDIELMPYEETVTLPGWDKE
jgi:cobyrinic acid a,c-diamide synthase